MRTRVFVLLSIVAFVGSGTAWAGPVGSRDMAGALPPLPTPGVSPGDILPPVIQQAPADIFYGQPFIIVTPDARRVIKVGMLSVGGGGKSVTLTILGRSDNTLKVAAPASQQEAPPGQYLLFIYAQGFGDPIPSLPALVTLSLPHPSPPPSSGPGPSPTSPHSPTPGATTGRGGGTGSGGGAASGGPSGTGSGGSGGGQGPSAAVATPASSEHSIGAAPWLGGLLLILLLATFFGLRRMLRA
jgi:hypothetical protein